MIIDIKRYRKIKTNHEFYGGRNNSSIWGASNQVCERSLDEFLIFERFDVVHFYYINLTMEYLR